jgi:transcriptional regulator with XRE-family HTH domain
MAAREPKVDRVTVRTQTQTKRWADEVRAARLNLGLSQALVAKRAKVDRAAWSRLERGKGKVVTFDLACRMSAAVGLDFVVNLYRSDTALRDVAHVRLLQDVRRMLGPDWSWRYEVPLGLAPEQRAWDAVAVHDRTQLAIRVEAETRLRDAQATLRRLESKRVADGEPRLVLAVRDTRNNRDAVREAAEILASAFPALRCSALARLRAGEDPGADLLLMVDWIRVTAEAS